MTVGEGRMKVDIFTDGSSRGNPGPGGYAAVLRYVDTRGNVHERELSAGFLMTTNNRMELMGAIAALEALLKPCDVTLTSDSKYLIDAFNKGWIDSWQKKGWIKADRKPVLNKDLWQRLLKAMESHKVTFVWVEGHAGHPENERCDHLATEAADNGPYLEDEGFEEIYSSN